MQRVRMASQRSVHEDLGNSFDHLSNENPLHKQRYDAAHVAVVVPFYKRGQYQAASESDEDTASVGGSQCQLDKHQAGVEEKVEIEDQNSRPQKRRAVQKLSIQRADETANKSKNGTTDWIVPDHDQKGTRESKPSASANGPGHIADIQTTGIESVVLVLQTSDGSKRNIRVDMSQVLKMTSRRVEFRYEDVD
jgi:hypothetical protein